jgi:hypothetical protein
MTNTRLNLLSPVLFYQTPVDIFQTQNGSTQVDGRPTEFKNCRGCNQNLASDDPASQYQRQKLIQNTVRVSSSLYTMNLAGLAGYQKPSDKYQLIEQVNMPYSAPPSVNWNQMSDRANPARQLTKVASGSSYHSSSTKHSITRNRPGAMSPGGLGVDIKHNSYERRLNKLKGKAVLRRGVIPPNYGAPINFDRAYPVYGGKVVKTAIINNCDCPNVTDNSAADKRIYGSVLNAIQEQILAVGYKFSVGDFVWAKKDILLSTELYKAQIVKIVNGVYEIKFVDDGSIEYKSYDSLLIYFDCDCSFEPSLEEEIIANQYSSKSINELINSTTETGCNLLTLLAASEIL